MDKHARELGTEFAPKFDDHGLLPCVTVHAESKDVLMVAFMNQESLDETLRSGHVTYWSRSRGKLWKKGESSGMTQHLKRLRVDCDQDCLVAEVVVGDPKTTPQAACHTGYASCFYRAVRPDGTLEFVENEKAFDPNAVYG
ncbi:MAG: phosphoribosyl-AMP cyclohydrolase [Planctomycetota bacterium]